MGYMGPFQWTSWAEVSLSENGRPPSPIRRSMSATLAALTAQGEHQMANPLGDRQVASTFEGELSSLWSQDYAKQVYSKLFEL